MYPVISQDFHEEHALQAFRRMDKDDRGYINTVQFVDIMTTLKQALLTDFVKDNLIGVRHPRIL